MSKSTEAKGLTVQAYADHRKGRGLPGGSRWAVNKALRDARITRNANGKIDPMIADTDWERNTDTIKRTGKQQVQTRLEGGATSRVPTINQSRSITEAFKAKMARLQYEEKAGKLVDVDEVKSDAFRCAQLVRDRVLAIPTRVSAELAAESDPDLVQAFLERAFREVLTEMADNMEKGVGGSRPPVA